MAPDWMDLYRDAGGRWRWRRMSGNGRIVSDSGQGYVFKNSAKRAAKREAPDLLIVERTK